MTPARRINATHLVLSVCLLYMPAARSFYATFDSNARLAEEFNTNLFLNPGPHTDAWGQGIDGGMTMTGIERDWKTALSANFNNRWYVTDSNLTYYNQFFSWKNSYFTERSKFALDLQYNNDNTLTTGADAASSLGYVFERVPRTDKIIAPQWSFSLTPRTLLNVAYNFRDSDYEEDRQKQEQLDNVFPNTQSHLGSVDLSYDWSKRLKVFGSSYYSYYSLSYPAKITSNQPIFVEVFPGLPPFAFNGTTYSPAVTSDIQTVNLSLGFKYLLTETIDVNFSAGAQRNQTHRPAYDVSQFVDVGNGNFEQVAPRPQPQLSSITYTEIFSLAVNKRLSESSSLALQYNRSINPNLLGDLITYDRVALMGQHQFASQLNASLNLSYSNQIFPTPSQQTSSVNFNYEIVRYGMESQINWFFEKDWSLNAAYRFFHQEYIYTGNQSNTPDQSADSHGIYVYILHTFDQLRP